MNNKKTMLYGALMTLLVFTSCSTKDNESTQSLTYPATNLITNTDSGESSVSDGSYRFYFNITKNLATVGTDNLTFNNATHGFTTSETSYQGYLYNNGSQTIKISNPKGYMDNSQSWPITDAEFYIVTGVYGSNLVIPGMANPQGFPLLVCGYNIGDEYEVRTFNKDCFYHGETETIIYGEGGEKVSWINKDMYYRIVIDITSSKADLVIYEAKFAEAMPVTLKAIIVEDLDVTWGAGKYTLHGSNIIPLVLEGSETTPYPNFTFDSIDISTTSSNLTEIEINYILRGGGYEGKFTGSNLISPLP